MQTLHAMHGRARGLGNCGLGALDLLINKTLFNVGEAPMYTVIGATPNAAVLWNSTQNGLPTGENKSDYGHKTDSVGSWSAAGGNWVPAHAGTWTKSVSVGDEVDTVAFTVLPQGATTQPVASIPYPSSNTVNQSSSDDIDLMGFKVPRTAAYIGGALLAFYLLKKK